MQPLPSVPQLTPEELTAAMQGQITPQMMQKAAQLMQDPQVRAQMAQLEAMFKKGQLSPEMMKQMLGGNLGDPLSLLPPELQGITLNHLLKTGAIASILGLGAGYGMDRLMNGIQSAPNTLLERMLKRIESVSPVKKINDSLENRLKKIKSANPARYSRWLGMDGTYYSPAESLKHFYASYIGPQGHLSSKLRDLKLPSHLMARLNQSASRAELLQVLESSAVHFLPDSLQDIARSELHGGKLGQLAKKALGKSAASSASYSQATSTLRQLDRLMDKNQFVKLLEEAASQNRLSPGSFQSILSQLESPVGKSGGHLGDRFVGNLTRLMQEPNQRPLQSEIKRILGLKGNVGYEAIETALKKVSGRKALWQAVQESSRGLLAGELTPSPNMTLGQLESHFNRHHIMQRLNRTGTGQKLRSLLKGLLKWSTGVENHVKGALQEEHAFCKAMKARNIGPIGRSVGKALYYFQRLFSNGSRFGGLGNLVSKSFSGRLFGFNRLIASMMIFGFAVSGFLRAEKDLRFPKFADTLASGLGGWWGYELGRSLVTQLGLLTRNRWIASLSLKRCLGFLPWTWGSVLGGFIIPAVAASACGFLAQKAVHPFFGDPEWLKKAKEQREQEKLFEADRNRPLKSQQGLFERYMGANPPGNAGVTQGIQQSPSLDETSLSPESVGFTPMQIEQNRIADQQTQELNHLLSHGRDFKKRLWGTH